MNKLYAIILSAFFVFSAEAKEMSFWVAGSGGNCNSCRWIVADGEIKKGTTKKLKKLLSKMNHKPGEYFGIYLNSHGGDLIEGLQLGNLIRKHKLATFVAKTIKYEKVYTSEAGECYSSCSYAFLGGISRDATSYIGSKFGVHQYYTAAALSAPEKKAFSSIDLSVNQVITGVLLEYVIRMGVDPKLVALSAVTTPWEKIQIISTKDLYQLKIDTTEEKLGKWEIVPFKSGVMAQVSQVQSDAEQGTKQLKIYCESSNNRIYIIVRGVFNKENITQYNGDISDLLSDVKSLTIKANNKEIKHTKSPIKRQYNIPEGVIVLLGTELSSRNIKEILNSGKLSISAGIWQRLWFIGSSDFSINNGRKQIRIALKNCI